jgi:hypothetical protein
VHDGDDVGDGGVASKYSSSLLSASATAAAAPHSVQRQQQLLLSFFSDGSFSSFSVGAEQQRQLLLAYALQQ